MSIIQNLIVSISGGLIGGYTSYYFSEKVENYKFELLKKEQAIAVAELFAFWIRYDNQTINALSDVHKKDYFEKMNRLTWEISIWIDDEGIVKKIMKRLENKTDIEIKTIILEVRELVQKRKNNNLKPDDLVHFE